MIESALTLTTSSVRYTQTVEVMTVTGSDTVPAQIVTELWVKYTAEDTVNQITANDIRHIFLNSDRALGTEFTAYQDLTESQVLAWANAQVAWENMKSRLDFDLANQLRILEESRQAQPVGESLTPTPTQTVTRQAPPWSTGSNVLTDLGGPARITLLFD
jgi:hypothetical protein